MAASVSRWLAFWLQIIYFSHKLTAFNLDTSIPIVKEGIHSSYFGFSVAQHYIGLENRHVILVGAPKDNITNRLAPDPVRQINQPGTVYKCPISSIMDDCDALQLDWNIPASDEDKSDQWMGVTVKSQGTTEGLAVACAHRYKTRGSAFVWGLGTCITMSNELDEEDYLEPCRGRSYQKGHGEYGYCQSGTAFDFAEDGTYLIGAPGPYNWRGAIWKNIIPKEITVTAEWYWNALMDPENGKPDQPPAPTLPYYANLGMSAKISNILGKRTYVGGAPRSKYTGEVLLFTQTEEDYGVAQKFLIVEPDHQLQGEQFGSNFGHSLAVLDFNKDGLEDLVVGAPFYQDESIGGAIYVYMNGPEGITSSTKPLRITSRAMNQTECKVLDCTNARFGYTLEAIGDVDLDNYPDLAVGAPYEGNGVVYIFRGSQDGIIPEYSQRIVASDLQRARPLIGFGHSLSGGIDVDGNGYPDLTIGAYNSDKVVVLLARPVINVTATLTSQPNTIDPNVERCPQVGKSNNCFTVTVCFKFTAEPKDTFTERIWLDYKLEAEKYTGRQVSRIYLRGADQDKPYMLESSMQLREQSNPNLRCRTDMAYIIKNNRDFLNPINLRLTYKLKEQAPPTMNEGDNVPNINTYPVLNTAAAKKELAIDFVKNCGVDSMCQSDLQVQARFPGLTEDEDGSYIFKMDRGRELQMDVRVTNDQPDEAHDSMLTILLPSNVSYINIIQRQGVAVCTPSQDIVTCGIGNPLKGHAAVAFTIRMEVVDVSLGAKQMEFKLRANTTSIEVEEGDNTMYLAVNVVLETDLLLRGTSNPKTVWYGGVVRGESAITDENQIGAKIEHVYEIKNVGNNRVPNASVVIHWPYEYEIGYPEGKHLLYLVQEPIVDFPGRCNINPKMIDPIDVRSKQAGRQLDSEQEKRRFRRNKKSPPRPRYRTDGNEVIKLATVNCTNGYAKCFNFTCTVGPLSGQQSVSIKIVSRLWNSTFLEEFRSYDLVEVQSHGEIFLDPAFNIKQISLFNDRATVTTDAKADIKAKEPKQVPLWVWILAAIGGLLLLIIIIILLWKCGFFKRKRPDDMQRHQGKVQKKKKMQYEDEYN